MSVADDFRRLLDSEPREEAIQTFLAENPCILKEWCGAKSDNACVLPKVSFHHHVTDFAVGDWDPTLERWVWTLIEIERPDYKLFTATGDPTKELNHAIRQITDWRAWIQNNLHYARELLTDVLPLCSAAVIIGRREHIRPGDRNRLEMLRIQSAKLSITTFDALLDSCKRLGEENNEL